MNPLKGEVGGIQSPLAVELYRLGVRKFVGKGGAPRPRGEKGRGLKGHHGPREEAQGASVHLEALQNIRRVEEPDHGDSEGELS